MADNERMENRTPPGVAEQANQARRAWFDLCDLARTMPDWPNRNPTEVAEKARRRSGWQGTDADAEALWAAYRNSPHVCPVTTWHLFDRPCAESKRAGSDHHPGCCPGRCPYPPLR